jgi:RNA polymerase sigma factor (sigma-70 family)
MKQACLGRADRKLLAGYNLDERERDGARHEVFAGGTQCPISHTLKPLPAASTCQTKLPIHASRALRIPAKRSNVGYRRASSPSESTMRPTSPELERLLAADTAAEEERAWREFAAAYSRLILHATRSVAGTHDDSMDAYARILEHLRADRFARLRAYVADGRSKFSTWLVVVARRLALDQLRQTYGRPRGSQSDGAKLERAFRRRLRDLAGDDVELETLPGSDETPDAALRVDDLRTALAAAVDSLDPADRLLLSLRFDDDLSAQEIARLLHLPTPFHVYRRIDHVLLALRQQLAARGVDSGVP